MTTKKEILKAIREKCLDCCCGSFQEVSMCAVGTKCSLYEFRMGNDPNPCKTKGFQKIQFVRDEFLENIEE